MFIPSKKFEMQAPDGPLTKLILEDKDTAQLEPDIEDALDWEIKMQSCDKVKG